MSCAHTLMDVPTAPAMEAETVWVCPFAGVGVQDLAIPILCHNTPSHVAGGFTRERRELRRLNICVFFISSLLRAARSIVACRSVIAAA
jgi:hypothetical protein